MLQVFRVRVAALAGLPLRGLAPGAAKKGGKDKGPRKIGEMSKTHATGCALMKGEQDPAFKPDDQYPAWLWDLLKPEPSPKELAAKYQGMGLSVAQLQRLWRLKNKERIKEGNFLKAKQ
mmetsp:Transcript_7768/g.19273  ORF Transcript_7768/g.19273 Transcript_7768/m.19273 type:complete len:119 (-) Transcript_7768:616-972(-)